MAGSSPGPIPEEIDIRFGGQHRIMPLHVLGLTAGGDKSLLSRLCVLYGWSAVETTGAAGARARLYDSQDASGEVAGNIGMPTSGSDQMWMGEHGVPVTVGLFLHVVSGTMDLTVYVAYAGVPLDPA